LSGSDLRGKAAIVTGSATGVGRSVALALAQLGCNVVVNYTRSESEAADTLRAIETAGAEGIVVRGDVSIDADCRRIVEETHKRWNRLDILVNNAGTTVFVAHKELEALTEEAWDLVFAVNVKGAFQMARAAATSLRASKRGAIVNVSSTAAFSGGGSSIPYAASKAALNTLTRSLARVLAPEVRVNGVAPGFVDTRWLAQGYGDRLDAMRRVVQRETPLRDTGRPDHVAQAVLSLVSGMDWMTGETLVLDGGFGIRP
jgi:3-oxoacyl-[acyl-carrier protein] reductase